MAQPYEAPTSPLDDPKGAEHVEHATEVGASAQAVYRLLADLGNWPRIFGPFVHLEVLSTDGATERIGMWTTDGDRVEHWVALRRLDEEGLRIDFRPETVPPGLESMERSWVVEPVSRQTCVARLVHTYRVKADQDGPAAVARTVEEISRAELTAVKAAAELDNTSPELLLVLEDRVDIAGPAHDVYAFLYAAEHWSERLPHVARVEVRQDSSGLQLLEVDTRESRGGVFTTRTARVGFPDRALVYKQLALPPLGSSHHVSWRITETATGAAVHSEQVVVVRPAGVTELFGAGSDPEEATSFIRRELHAKVRLVLDGAKEYVEARH